MQQPTDEQRNLVKPTYAVTIFMLVIGQLQATLVMEMKIVKDFMETRYILSLILFFISFLSIQLYGFFYRLIVTKSIWLRILAGLWTFQINTLSIMKPAKRAPYFSLAVSFVFTYTMLVVSAIYGKAAKKHRRGLFMSRQMVILWSERLFVVTCFGIIVCNEMKDDQIEFTTLIVYTLMSNVFVLIFAASLRRPNFYHPHILGDYVLIGQLYYLNFFALYMSIVWSVDSFLELTKWNINVLKFLYGERKGLN